MVHVHSDIMTFMFSLRGSWLVESIEDYRASNKKVLNILYFYFRTSQIWVKIKDAHHIANLYSFVTWITHLSPCTLSHSVLSLLSSHHRRSRWSLGWSSSSPGGPWPGAMYAFGWRLFQVFPSALGRVFQNVTNPARWAGVWCAACTL